MRPTLCALPNELLIHTFSYLSGRPDDLYALSISGSRRITSAALPIFLAHHGSSLGRNTAFVIEDWNPIFNYRTRRVVPDGLSGLSIAAIIGCPRKDRTLASLRCSFQDLVTHYQRKAKQRMVHLPSAILRVLRFVNKFDSIDRADISFVWDTYHVSDDIREGYVPLEELEQWRESMGTLLNALVKKGCQRLAVHHGAGRFQQARFRFQQETRLWKTFAYSLLKPIRGPGFVSNNEPPLKWDWIPPAGQEEQYRGRTLEPFRLSNQAARIKRLEALIIHSDTLLVPPFIDWTLSLLQTKSSVRNLSLSNITLPRPYLDSVLRGLCSALTSHLTSLSIHPLCTHLEPSHIFFLLSNLPQLSHFYLDRRYGPSFRSTRQHSTAPAIVRRALRTLARITSLSVPTDFLECIHQALKTHSRRKIAFVSASPMSPMRASSFPNLTRLCVFTSGPLRSSTLEATAKEATLVNSSIEPLLKNPGQLASRPELSIALAEHMELFDFPALADAIQAQYGTGKNHAVRRDDLTTPTNDSPPPGSSAASNSPASQRGVGPPPFLHIDHLILIPIRGYSEERGMGWVQSLCIWLRFFFPRLVRLTLKLKVPGSMESELLDVDQGIVRVQDPTKPMMGGQWDLEDGDEHDPRVPRDVVRMLIAELREVCPNVKRLVVGRKEVLL